MVLFPKGDEDLPLRPVEEFEASVYGRKDRRTEGRGVMVTIRFKGGDVVAATFTPEQATTLKNALERLIPVAKRGDA